MPQHFQVGLKAVIVREQRVLLLKFRSARGGGDLHWDLPGGRIDDTETFADALAREFREELPEASAPRVGRLLHADRAPGMFPDGTGLVWLFYDVLVDVPEPVVLSDEHVGYVWASLTDLDRLFTQQAELSFAAALYRGARLGLTSAVPVPADLAK